MSRKSKIFRSHSSDIINASSTMSEKVQLVANSIYQEFERMISHFGSEVLECLMPLIVGVLENLDELYKTKQNDDLEIEIIREDNETLSSQYEKEKSLRKHAEERLFDTEYLFEEEKKKLLERCQEMESLLRISELKLRSSNDMIARMEKKERDIRNENQKLYERYTDLFKSHGDLLQRLKRYNFAAPSTPPLPPPAIHTVKDLKSLNLLNNETNETCAKSENPSSKSTHRNTVPIDHYHTKSVDNTRRDCYKEETVAEIFGDDQWMTDPISDSLFFSQHHSAIPCSDFTNNPNDNKSQFSSTPSNTEDEMCLVDNSLEYNNADSDTDLTDDEFGIRKEIEGLIKENQDLVDTKNALNIVKDDLINRLDNLTGENDVLREDIHQYHNRQLDLTSKVAYLEQELRKCKEEIKNLNETLLTNTKVDTNTEQKSFSRSDMAVLLQERNHFKERLMELQDALVYTEMMRVKKQFPEPNDILKSQKSSNSSVWNFFKNVSKSDKDCDPEDIEKKSSILKNRFRLETNRSQLYSWSIPRVLRESSIPKRIPIPIKIQKIFEPKDIVICGTQGYEEFPDNRSATYMWYLVQTGNKHYSLIQLSLCSKQPEFINKYSINLPFPTMPFSMCEVPALIYVIKELGTIRSLVGDDETVTTKDISTEQSKSMTKIFHTKVNIKQKSKSTMGNKTLWFGCEKNQLVVFVLLDNNKLEGRMATASLPSEIDYIKYYIGRVFVMTKNGSVCIFDLNKEVNQWDLHQCLIVEVSNGLPIASSCCDPECIQLWLVSSTNCYVLNLGNLSTTNSWSITDDSTSLDQCVAIEWIVKIDKLSLVMFAVSRVGSLIGYDNKTLQMKISIDLRPCVFDLIEPMSGITTTILSLYNLIDDGNRLWMTTDGGMILFITLDCLQGHLNRRQSQVSLHSDEVLISSHAFAQSVKTVCMLTYSLSNAAIGDVESAKAITDQKVLSDNLSQQSTLLMIALGSNYVNLNNTISDTINLSNQALIWKI